MKLKVYVETSVVSYLTAWRSPQLIMAAQQEATRNWWDSRHDLYDIFISEAVLDEAEGGDPEAAKRRLEVLELLDQLPITGAAIRLATLLLSNVPLPPKAHVDALHIAIAATHGMDYLLTWNCTHIANPKFRYVIEEICRQNGFQAPVICTPFDLIEDQ